MNVKLNSVTSEKDFLEWVDDLINYRTNNAK
jgi:hypothetical protein